MKTSVSAKGLVRTIERRLAEISDQQHALAVERTRLLEHVTPLRLGVLAPETALVLLRNSGITLRGVGSGRAARRSRDRALQAVARSAVASLVSDAVAVQPSPPIPIRRGFSGAS